MFYFKNFSIKIVNKTILFQRLKFNYETLVVNILKSITPLLIIFVTLGS